MKLSELKEIIREELQNIMEELNEKSVPQPYNRKEARPMNGSQVKKRDKIGKAMLADPKTVKGFKERHGNEWEDYLWATATSKAMNGGE